VGAISFMPVSQIISRRVTVGWASGDWHSPSLLKIAFADIGFGTFTVMVGFSRLSFACNEDIEGSWIQAAAYEGRTKDC